MHPYVRWRDRRATTCSLDDMRDYWQHQARSSFKFKKGDVVTGKNRSCEYSYILTARPARAASEIRGEYTLSDGSVRKFVPYMHPRDMLSAGVFSGKMVNDCLHRRITGDFTEPFTNNVPLSRPLSP